MAFYMVIEHIREGQLEAVYKRFANQGRLLPEGLEYVDSWLSADNSRCFQIMQSTDERLFSIWFDRWSDLVEFELIPLRQKPAVNG